MRHIRRLHVSWSNRLAFNSPELRFDFIFGTPALQQLWVAFAALFGLRVLQLIFVLHIDPLRATAIHSAIQRTLADTANHPLLRRV